MTFNQLIGYSLKPMPSLQYLFFSLVTGLISASAIISSLEMYDRSMTLFATFFYKVVLCIYMLRPSMIIIRAHQFYCTLLI